MSRFLPTFWHWYREVAFFRYNGRGCKAVHTIIVLTASFANGTPPTISDVMRLAETNIDSIGL